MKQGIKLMMIGSGLAVLGAAAASAAATERLVEVALDRELPRSLAYDSKARTRLTGSPVDLEMLRRLEQAGERLKASDHQRVEILAPDGARLVGHWKPCSKPKRVILAMHGWRSSWHRDFGLVADFWQENGCSVLYVEQRGQGESGGEHMGFGMTERHDVPLWVRWINETTGGKLPIYPVGVSMGATTVLMASDLPLPENVRGIVADCGFTSPKAIWQHVAKNNLHLLYGPRAALVDALCRKRIQMGSGDYSAVQALKKTRLPVLLVHGTEDRFVPVEMSYENYKACAGPKKLLIVPGADHGGSYLKDPEAYQKALREFWQENDTLTE